MKINGKIVEISDQLSLTQILESEGFNIQTVVVEMNGEVVNRGEFSDVMPGADAVLEVLNFVGGG